MSAYLLPLLSLIVGALIGLFSTLLASSIRQRQDITLRLLDQYLLVRREVVDAVSELSNMSIRDEFHSDKWEKHQAAISKLFYQHYDFLPKAVLDSLTLLYVCLSKPNGTLFTFRDGAVVQMDECDMAPFIGACSIFSNSCYAKQKSLINLTDEQVNVGHLHGLPDLFVRASLGDRTRPLA
jgi:hypothetical protein